MVGYGIVTKSRSRKYELAHRLSYKVFVGPIPKGKFICHHCDVRNCVNPRHLFVGTQADNVRDMVAKKRHLHGERHHKAKLTEAEVLAINSDTRSKHALAKQYDVSRKAIQKIKRHETWKHLWH